MKKELRRSEKLFVKQTGRIGLICEVLFLCNRKNIVAFAQNGT